MESITVRSQSLTELESRLSGLYLRRQEISALLTRSRQVLFFLRPVQFLLGSLIPSLTRKLKQQEVELSHLENQLADSIVVLDWGDSVSKQAWDTVSISFTSLMSSKRMWRVVGSVLLNRTEERTAASIGRQREGFIYEYKNIPFINSEHKALYIAVTERKELYLYPSFIIMLEGSSINVLPLSTEILQTKIIEYIEEEPLSKDASVVRTTWEKANLDGSADKRFSDNIQIPLVAYALLTVRVANYKITQFLCSDSQAGTSFSQKWKRYSSEVGSMLE